MGEARTWGARFADRTAEQRLLMAVLVGFGAIAALLAAIGVYGLFSWSVALRRRELAIRLALGARPALVGGRVVGHSIMLVTAGLAGGLLIVRVSERLLATVLYGVTPGDPRDARRSRGGAQSGVAEPSVTRRRPMSGRIVRRGRHLAALFIFRRTSMRLSLRIAALAAVTLMIAAAPAAAQTPQGEVSVGYQALHVPDLWFPAGFAVDGAYNLSDQVGVVGEFGWSHKSASQDAGIATAEGSLNAYTFAGGVRVSGRGYAAVTPFAQVLVGGLHATGSASVSAGGVTIGASDSTTEFMVQPGAGVVVPVGTNVGVVGQIDYRRVFFENAGENEYRIFAGIRVGM